MCKGRLGRSNLQVLNQRDSVLQRYHATLVYQNQHSSQIDVGHLLEAELHALFKETKLSRELGTERDNRRRCDCIILIVPWEMWETFRGLHDSREEISHLFNADKRVQGSFCRRLAKRVQMDHLRPDFPMGTTFRAYIVIFLSGEELYLQDLKMVESLKGSQIPLIFNLTWISRTGNTINLRAVKSV